MPPLVGPQHSRPLIHNISRPLTVVTRAFHISSRNAQADGVVEDVTPQPRIRTHPLHSPSWSAVSPEFDRITASRNHRRSSKPQQGYISRHRQVSPQSKPRHESTAGRKFSRSWPELNTEDPNLVQVDVAGNLHDFSPLVLRDLCACPHCIDTSTKQKHFVTADLPSDIRAKTVESTPLGTRLIWENDIPGYGDTHETVIPTSTLEQLVQYGRLAPRQRHPKRVLWDASMYEQQTQDMDYESYMNDDSALFKALQQLHTHGLLFVTNVPEDEKSVEAVGERIGPLKTTFYGRTWDVRSVPEAINVAYTAQNLGFHMDLMYMKQPPHIQLLHCIRSSAKGGASLFSDSFRAAAHLGEMDPAAWHHLTRQYVDFHYDHPGSQYYHQSRVTIAQQSVVVGNDAVHNWEKYQLLKSKPENSTWPKLTPADFIDNVSWSPPFQAPFAIRKSTSTNANLLSDGRTILGLNDKLRSWHPAAKKFNELIHKPEVIYERLMKPGECVIFDNRRVLHARKAFEVGDAGTERWLRGAYLDKDPYMSKMKILTDVHDPSQN